MYGDEVTLQYKGETSHQSFMGGCFSIFGGLILIGYVSFCCMIWYFKEDDSIKSYYQFDNFEHIGIIPLLDNDYFNFVIYIQDANFNNSYNPYGRIVLNRITTFDDQHELEE